MNKTENIICYVDESAKNIFEKIFYYYGILLLWELC